MTDAAMHARFACLLAGLWLTLFSALVVAQLVERRVDIHSEGTRMGGFVMHPAVKDGTKLPALILSHGWGGTAALLRPEAERFAQAGYYVLAFDYRGWGDSDGRPVRDDAGKPGAQRELREVVHPLDQATDIFNAVHWIAGEPLVDTSRIGLWGTSFSGGLAAYVAAREPRVRALVAQVAAFGRPVTIMPPSALAQARGDATRRARGEIGHPAPGVREIGNLRGAPIREAFLRYAPIEDISTLRDCATLIIDAEREELFDLREHGELAFRRAPEPKKRVVIPGIAHYGIYTTARTQAQTLAVDWFDQHLKAGR
jgi:dienelactone hydrolase